MNTDRVKYLYEPVITLTSEGIRSVTEMRLCIEK